METVQVEQGSLSLARRGPHRLVVTSLKALNKGMIASTTWAVKQQVWE